MITIFSTVTSARSAARPPRPGNGAPRSEMPNAISAPGTAIPAMRSSGASIDLGYRGPGGRQHDAEHRRRGSPGSASAGSITRRQDGRRPISTTSSTTNAIGASTTSWYSITGATNVASPKT